MSDRTKIEWATTSWNPIRAIDKNGKSIYHCTKVSAGCQNCYAEIMSKLYFGGSDFKKDDSIKFVIKYSELEKPEHWTKKKRIIFVQSMGDIFHEKIPFAFVSQIFKVAEECHNHKFLILTKRPERALEFSIVCKNWPMNVWFGVTAEDQKSWNERVGYLSMIPAFIRFVSIEPMLESIDISNVQRNFDDIPFHWVIVGGESGRRARPASLPGIRTIRDYCVKNSIAFFFKQWGEWAPAEEGGHDNGYLWLSGRKMRRETIDGVDMVKVGKENAGRRLDGYLWEQFPHDTLVIARKRKFI